MPTIKRDVAHCKPPGGFGCPLSALPSPEGGHPLWKLCAGATAAPCPGHVPSCQGEARAEAVQEEGKQPTAPTELCLATLQAASQVFLLLSIQSAGVSDPSLLYTSDWCLLRTLSFLLQL